MTYRFIFKPQLLALLGFLIMGCANQNESKEKETITDTTSDNKTDKSNRVAFDTSHSVTTISPNLYKKLADTLNIRMLMGTYKPGDSSIMHAHPDFALYVLDGSTVELTAENGSKQNIAFKKGMAVVLPATTHSAKNIGNTTLRLVVVEVNRPRD
jgi:quercetin dioxygenase-like cupin family protein